MFGRYRVGELLGRGGMGEVHRAVDTENDRVVALKRLFATGAGDNDKARFRRESRIASSLDTPHMTTIYDYGEIDDQLYLAMRLVEGTDLRRVLDDEVRLEPGRAVRILTEIATALDAAHAAGIVHRDVKPSNVLLDASDTAYLADFGIAKSLAPDATSVTRADAEIGTLDYMAPERLMRAGADYRADVYSLAGVLFECLTGRKPFPASDSAGKLAAQLNDPPPVPSLFDWRIPRAVDAVIATGMDKEPARRYPSAGELMAAASSALEQQSGSAPLTTPDFADTPDKSQIMDAIVVAASRRPGAGSDAPDGPTLPVDECPYPGLRSFTGSDAGVFFGREHAVTDVLVRLSRQSPSSGPLLVVGASGAGKSSLLQAGVLPALRQVDDPWPQVMTTPGPNPIGSLAARLAPLVGADPNGLARWLYERPWEFGRLCARIGAAGGRHGRLVLVVDQFEELFTSAAAAQRQPFATLLASAWPALVVLGLRADFVEQCLRVPALRPALASPYPLGPLTAPELERVIAEPARAAGLRLEDGLADRLITDIGAGEDTYNASTLPQLAHALRETWRNRSGTTLTLKGYQDTGGVGRAVALTAEGVYNRLSEVDRQQLRTSLLRMVTVLEGGGVARRKVASGELPEHILAVLVNARLVAAEADGVQLSHDALLSAWPRLREWVEQDRQGLLLRQHLRQTAATWQATGYDQGELYRGARLAAVLDWASGRTDLTESEGRFLRESQRAQQRATRRLRSLVTGLAAFLVLALVAGVVAAVKWGDAESAAADSESRRLAVEALTDAPTDPIGARRKALLAWQTSQTRQARGALLSTAATTEYPVRIATELDTVYVVDTTRNGELIAAGGPDGRTVVLDALTRRPISAEFAGQTGPINAVEFSPDGTMLATASQGDEDESPSVRIWEIPSGRLVSEVEGGAGVWWQAEGNWFATIGFTRRGKAAVGAWDPRTGERLRWLTGAYRQDNAFLFDLNQDGDRVAFGRTDGVVDLWNARTRKLVHRETAHRDAAPASADREDPTTVGPRVAFSADLLASASGIDDRIRFADPRTGEPRGEPITTVGTQTQALEFVPEGGEVLTLADTAVGIARWNVGTREGSKALVQGPAAQRAGLGSIGSIATARNGDIVGGELSGGNVVLWPRNPGWHTAPMYDAFKVSFSSDGRLAATSGEGTYVWNVKTGDPEWLHLNVASAVYLPGGRLVLAGRDGKVKVWSSDGKQLRTLAVDLAEGGSAVAIASPDGSMFAVKTSTSALDADDRHTITVWDAATYRQLAVLDFERDGVGTPVFSPDGRTLTAPVTIKPTAGPDGWSNELQRWRTSDFERLEPVELAVNVNITYTPDGSALIATRGDRLQVRDPETGAVRREFGRHPDVIRGFAVSPDGKTVATGTRGDPIVRLWDLASGELVAELSGHEDGVGSIRFSPDGSRLASASSDTDIGVWPTDPENAVRELCADLADAEEQDLASLGCPGQSPG